MTNIQIPILLRKRVWLFIEPFPPLTSPIFRCTPMDIVDKEEKYPLPEHNSSPRASSCNVFLLPAPDGGIYGVFFDARHMEEPLSDSVHVTLIIV